MHALLRYYIFIVVLLYCNNAVLLGLQTLSLREELNVL